MIAVGKLMLVFDQAMYNDVYVNMSGIDRTYIRSYEIEFRLELDFEFNYR
jgi:hypothetical protein